MKNSDCLTNHFLIATPAMNDPNFLQTVTYVCEHNENGALGIVINRPTSVKLVEILEQLEIQCKNDLIQEAPILFGGPVHQERGFVIHRPIGEWRSTFSPAENIAITTSRDILQAIANKEGPEDLIVTLGYAGWGAGQLEAELSASTWLSCIATETILFETPFEKRWDAAAALLGIKDMFMLSGDTGHA